MDYPREFDKIGGGKMIAAEIKASREVSEPLHQPHGALIPGTSYRSEAGKLFQYILTVFEAFANEACVLGRLETWTADRVDREVRQFLGTITLGARAKYDGR